MIKSFSVVTLVFLLAQGVEAKVYKWVDENGVIHYSGTDPKNGAQEMNVKGVSQAEKPESSDGNVSTAGVDCEQVVRHGLKLMEQDLIKESGDQAGPMIAVLKDPATIADGVAACQEDKSDPVKAAQWACQAKASSFQAVRACENK